MAIESEMEEGECSDPSNEIIIPIPLPVTVPVPVVAAVVKRKEKKEPRQNEYAGCGSFSSYTHLTKIGEGTFGEVSKATHAVSKKIFALKKILIHNDKEGIPITALREIKILKALKHVNIVPLSEMVFEHGDRDSRGRGTIYMVFPFLDHDLTGLLENQSVNLTQPQIKSYIKQLLCGTAYLHSMKILHRDMKCSNILIDNVGNLMLADFGLARTYTPEKADRQYTNNVVTRWYRPPELLLGETRYNGAIDLWGVGNPLFPGTSDLTQLGTYILKTLNNLDCIFQICGTPTLGDASAMADLPAFKESLATFNTTYPSTLLQVFARYDPLAVDLMRRLLDYDVTRRMTADQALKHKFDVYKSSHEFTSRQTQKKLHDIQKRTQGMHLTRPVSHYTDAAYIAKYRNYDSRLEEEKSERDLQRKKIEAERRRVESEKRREELERKSEDAGKRYTRKSRTEIERRDREDALWRREERRGSVERRRSRDRGRSRSRERRYDTRSPRRRSRSKSRRSISRKRGREVSVKRGIDRYIPEKRQRSGSRVERGGEKKRVISPEEEVVEFGDVGVKVDANLKIDVDMKTKVGVHTDLKNEAEIIKNEAENDAMVNVGVEDDVDVDTKVVADTEMEVDVNVDTNVAVECIPTTSTEDTILLSEIQTPEIEAGEVLSTEPRISTPPNPPPPEF